MSSSGRTTSVAAGDLQMFVAAERAPATLPPRPPPPSSSSSALVEYTPTAANPEDEDLEIKLRRIIECVPVRVSNTSGSSAGSGSGDFHQEIIEFLRPETINRPSTISTYFKPNYFRRVIMRLRDIGGEQLVDRFRQGCFGHLVGWEPGSKSNMSLHHMVSRQIKPPSAEDQEIWFFINGRRICFSFSDFALVTGLSFGTSSFDPTAEYDPRSVEVYRRFVGGGGTSIENLGVRFFDTDRPIDDDDGNLYLRVAHVLVLYAFVLGIDLPRPVDPWIWVLVDDLDVFARFPWAAYAYKILQYYMWNMKTKAKYHFYGPSWALYIWSLEIIPDLGATVAKYVRGDAYPRCMRWKFTKMIDEDTRPLFDHEGQPFLKLVPDDYERSMPYYTSSLYPGALGVNYRRPVPICTPGEQPPPRTRAQPHRRSRAEPSTDLDVGVSRRPIRSTRACTSVVDEIDAEHEEQRRQSVERERASDEGRRQDIGGRRQDTGKRARQSRSSSSSSGGEHHRRLSQHDRRWITDTIHDVVRENIQGLKTWFESMLDKTRCRCSHSNEAYTSSRRGTTPPPMRSDDQGRQPSTRTPTSGSDVLQQTHLSDPTSLVPQTDYTPHHQSLQVHGSSSGGISPSHSEDPARHSMPEMHMEQPRQLYRQMRRKEQDRLATMDADFQKREEVTEFAQRREERLKAAEERTAKKRLKRLKRKLKKKDKKVQN